MRGVLVLNQKLGFRYGLTVSETVLINYLGDRFLSKHTSELVVLSRDEIIKDLPVFFKKEDTVYRVLKGLDNKGLILLKSNKGVDSFSFSEKMKSNV